MDTIIPLNSSPATPSCEAPALPPAGERLHAPDLMGAAMVHAARMWSRRRERAALRKLDERMLRDIGLSAADAQQEADKWPWQP